MKKEIVLLLCLALASCDRLDVVGMISGSSPRVDTRFEQSMEYNNKVGEIHLSVPDSTYRVYVCTDTHVSDKNAYLTHFVKEYKKDSLCPFAVHLGDFIDGKNNQDFAYSALQATPTPYAPGKDTLFMVVGNHDLYFSQWEKHRSLFHTSVYWFDTNYKGKPLDLYICLDSGEGTLGVKQWAWLRGLFEEKKSVGYRHVIVFTHTHMFFKDRSQGHTSNYAMEETMELTSLFRKYGVAAYWSGHDHSREITEYNGVTYIIVDAMHQYEASPYYMIAEIGDQLSYQFVSPEE